MKLGPNKSRTLRRKMREFNGVLYGIPIIIGYSYDGETVDDFLEEEFSSLRKRKKK